MSLSHDVPLATSLGHCFYVLGSIQRTGEKLLLQYDTRQGEAEQYNPALLTFHSISQSGPLNNVYCVFSLSVRLLD